MPKTTEVIIAICIVLGVLAAAFGSGWYFRGVRAEKDMLFYQSSQQEAVNQDREEKQGKADSIDEEAAQQIQDLMIRNSELQRDLDAETAKPDYDCIVPADGVRMYNQHAVHPSKD